MTQPVQAARRARRPGDLAVSIVLLVGANIVFVIGAALAIFTAAFIDYCPKGCDSNTAITTQGITGEILLAVTVIGTVLVIVLLATRRRGLWVALATFAVVIVGWLVGFALFFRALNG